MKENVLFWAALSGVMLAQLLKVILVRLLEHKWSWERMTETGGMPSSHSAGVTALAAAAAVRYGLESPYFAIACVFGSIVIYDATGVRRAAGEHAEIINDLVQRFGHLWEEGDQPRALKTLLGHSYPQVLAGTLLGIFVGLWFGFYFPFF